MSTSTVHSFVNDDFINGLTEIRELGKGSHGSVYLMQSANGQKYAIKRQKIKVNSNNPGLRREIILDADALVRLKDVPEVIDLVGICYGQKYASIIIEAMDSDLHNFYALKMERIKDTPNLLQDRKSVV